MVQQKARSRHELSQWLICLLACKQPRGWRKNQHVALLAYERLEVKSVRTYIGIAIGAGDLESWFTV